MSYRPVNLLFVSALVAVFFMFIIPLKEGYFWFTFDNARDSLWVRDIVILHKPYLIGPWSSLGGVFFGPFWYYLLSLPFLLSSGHPAASVFMVQITLLLTVVIIYTFLKKNTNQETAFFASILLLFSNLLHAYGFVAFHANIIPLFTSVIIIAVYFVRAKNYIAVALAFFCTSLLYHFEPVFGIAMTASLVIYFLHQQKKLQLDRRSLLMVLVFFSLPFIPQLIFEIRHNFSETYSLILYFQGKNRTLEGGLPFLSRILNRVHLFSTTWNQTFGENQLLSWILFLGTLGYLNNQREAAFLNGRRLSFLLMIFIGGIFFTLIVFKEEAKSWYVTGVPVIYSLLVGLAFGWYFNFFPKIRYIIFCVFIAFIGVNISKYPVIKYHDQRSFNDPSIFTHEQEVVESVYRDAHGQGFYIYTYTPGVYDYPYQYLFWWYGGRKYGYLPKEFSYLPQKPPEYVPNKKIYESQFPQPQANMLYLIIERDNDHEDRVRSWYSTFENMSSPIMRIYYPFGVIVEKRVISL